MQEYIDLTVQGDINVVVPSRHTTNERTQQRQRQQQEPPPPPPPPPAAPHTPRLTLVPAPRPPSMRVSYGTQSQHQHQAPPPSNARRNAAVHVPRYCSCEAELKSGANKGSQCGVMVFLASHDTEPLCGRHKRAKQRRERQLQTCSICLEQMKTRKLSISLINCSHVFHKKCIQAWVEQNRRHSSVTCPLCRRKMFSFTRNVTIYC
jgi:hypothetical protein